VANISAYYYGMGLAAFPPGNPDKPALCFNVTPIQGDCFTRLVALSAINMMDDCCIA